MPRKVVRSCRATTLATLIATAATGSAFAQVTLTAVKVGDEVASFHMGPVRLRFAP